MADDEAEAAATYAEGSVWDTPIGLWARSQEQAMKDPEARPAEVLTGPDGMQQVGYAAPPPRGARPQRERNIGDYRPSRMLMRAVRGDN